MAALPNVYQASTDQRALLIAREQATVDAIKRRYILARLGIEGELEELLTKIERAIAAGKLPGYGTGPSTYSVSWLYRVGRLNSLLDSIATEVEAFSGEALKKTQAQGRIAIVTGEADARDLMSFSAGGSGGIKGANFAGPPPEAVERLSSYFGPKGPIPQAFDGFGDELIEAVRQELINGIAVGRNPRLVALRMLGVQQEGGILDGPFYKAARVARTEPLRAYREVGRETYQANRDVVGLWEWDATHDKRTCAFCLAKDGQRFSLEEAFATHPQCRCTQVPVTRLSKPKDVTGAEFFYTLSADDQDESLGSHGAGELYRSGRLPITAFVHNFDHPKWGPSGRLASLEMLMANGTVTTEEVARATERKTARAEVKPKRPRERKPTFPSLAPAGDPPKKTARKRKAS